MYDTKFAEALQPVWGGRISAGGAGRRLALDRMPGIGPTLVSVHTALQAT